MIQSLFVWYAYYKVKLFSICISAACRIDPQRHAVHHPNRRFFAVGEKVTVSCKSGFETKQDGNLSCQDDGNWDKIFPQCTGMKHLLYHAIENTVNQNSGKPLRIPHCYTQPSHRAPCICSTDFVDHCIFYDMSKGSRVFLENTSNLWDISWRTTRRRCITSMCLVRLGTTCEWAGSCEG